MDLNVFITFSYRSLISPNPPSLYLYPMIPLLSEQPMNAAEFTNTVCPIESSNRPSHDNSAFSQCHPDCDVVFLYVEACKDLTLTESGNHNSTQRWRIHAILWCSLPYSQGNNNSSGNSSYLPHKYVTDGRTPPRQNPNPNRRRTRTQCFRGDRKSVV